MARLISGVPFRESTRTARRFTVVPDPGSSRIAFCLREQVMNDGVWKSSSSRPGQSAGPTLCARPADRIAVHVADITHNPASSPGSDADADVPAPAGPSHLCRRIGGNGRGHPPLN